MHKFDYGEIRGNIPEDIVSLIRAISEINSMNQLREKKYAVEFEKVTKIAIMASTKYSNKIEGIITSDDRIAELILRSGVPITHDEEEIAGYRDALTNVHNDHENMDLNENTILTLHSTVVKYSNRVRAGYKKRDNAVISIDGLGNRSIVFRPVPASDVKTAMEQLTLAYLDERNNIEPLLLIPSLILDLLCIHPFDDGNGRVSRLMTEVLLYNYGFDVCRFISMDEHIFATRNNYYNSLAASSRGWIENKFSYFPFIRYFLRTLYECYIDLDTRFALVDGKKMKKNERIELILLRSLSPMSKKQLCYILPDISVRTVDVVIQKMQKECKIVKVGSFRDARYMAKR